MNRTGKDRKRSLRRSLYAPLLGAACILCGAVLAFAEIPSPSALKPVRIGILATRGVEECIERWGPTAEYLTRRVPGHSFSIVPLKFDEFHSAAIGGLVDFFLTNPSMYIEIEACHDAIRIATLKNRTAAGSVSTVSAGLVFCRADREDIRDAGDLKGKRFMAPDDWCTAAWLAVWHELKAKGVNPDRDFARLRFSGTHDAVVYAVRDGEADAGSVRDNTLERMAIEGKIRLADFKPLMVHGNETQEKDYFWHSTPHYPEWPFAKAGHTADALAEQVAVALMQMPADAPAARAAHCAGWTIPHNYQPVNRLLQDLRLPPYEDYGKVTLPNVLRQYRFWLLGILVLGLLICLFAVRSSRLNARLGQSVRAVKDEMARRERAQEELRKSEERFSGFARASGYGFAMGELDGRLVFGNSAVLKIVEEERESDFLARTFFEYYTEEDKERLRWEILPAVMKEGQWKGEIRILSSRGLLTPTEQNIFVIRDEHGTPRMVGNIITDITERLRVEAEKARIEEQYRQAQKVEAIGRLAGGVAHDLNNLLTPILGYGEMLLNDLTPDDRHKTALEQIVLAGSRARDLVHQLLAFGRKQTLKYRPVDLNLTIERFEGFLRRTIREDIEIEIHPAPSVRPVMADIGQIEQILMNLSVNAQDAMPEGGNLTLETDLADLDANYAARHPGVKPGEYVVLAVSDTGCGMNAETQKHIFEPFFSTKGEGGTGMGLATVYGIVKQHGGNIWVYSEAGKGTTFRIYLPVSGETGKAEQDGGMKPGDVRGSETILLVEDNEQVLATTREILEQLGYTVLVSGNGADALSILADHEGPIHLLLTDVVMPEMNGRALFARAAERHPGMKAVYMSGYSENVIAHRGVIEEGVVFLQKPFTVHGLGTKIREALETP